MPLEQVELSDNKSAPRCVNTRGHGTKGQALMPLDPTQVDPGPCERCGREKNCKHRPRRRPVRERLMEKVDVAESGCWMWTGAAIPLGYGQIHVDGKTAFAHRVSYELHVGPIPEGMPLDHLCRTPACVNPEHLEPVTHAENGRRGIQGALKTHCANGHPWVEENIMQNGPSARCCKVCHRDRQRERQRAARRAA